MLPHYLMKCNRSDAACRIIDQAHTHTHNTHQPALVRATYLLLWKIIINSVK